MTTAARLISIVTLAALLALPGPGRAEAPARHAPHPGALTVVSLNLAMREDVDRMAAELSATGVAQAADLFLLQEVARREPGPDVAAQLGERLGLESLYQEAFTLDRQRRRSTPRAAPRSDRCARPAAPARSWPGGP